MLISRTLPVAYVAQYQLNAFVMNHYQLVIVPGESSPFESLPIVHKTAPFLIRDVDELPTQQQAETLLGLLPGQKATLLVGCGTAQECHDLITHRLPQQPANLPLRIALPLEVDIDLACVSHAANVFIVRHYPLIETLPAVERVIAQAGYNVTHETRAVGVPSVLYPRQQKYDDQFTRARWHHGQAPNRQLSNGVHQAAQLIVATLKSA